MGVQKEQTSNREQTEAANVAAATGVQTGMRKMAASGEPAAIGGGTRSSWPAVTVVTFIMGVLIMMMFTKVGAAEHGLTQWITGSRQMEWDMERDSTQMKLIFQMVSDKVGAIDTLMRKVDLFDIEMQWREIESKQSKPTMTLSLYLKWASYSKQWINSVS